MGPGEAGLFGIAPLLSLDASLTHSLRLSMMVDSPSEDHIPSSASQQCSGQKSTHSVEVNKESGS